MSKKISNIVIMSVVFVVCLALSALACNNKTVSAMSSEKSGAISQHCATIKQSLKSLQKTDARSRSYLGSIYETIITKFIAPMNLRLIDTGQPNANLTDLHSVILNVRKEFTQNYTSYSQALEDLLATNCQTDPEGFYQKLIDTRQKRAEVSSLTTSLRNLFSEYLTGVRRIRNEYASRLEGSDGK